MNSQPPETDQTLRVAKQRRQPLNQRVPCSHWDPVEQQRAAQSTLLVEESVFQRTLSAPPTSRSPYSRWNTYPADTSRQTEVTRQGSDVMPFR